MGDTDNSDFGSDGGGKNYKCHVIPNALRVPKMYILSMLENSRVITIPITLCWVMTFFKSILAYCEPFMLILTIPIFPNDHITSIKLLSFINDDKQHSRRRDVTEPATRTISIPRAARTTSDS